MAFLTQVTGPFHRISGSQVEACRVVELLDEEQRTVLVRLVRGASLRTIASEMASTVSRIEAIKSDIHRKLGASTTADLIRIGIQAGIDD